MCQILYMYWNANKGYFDKSLQVSSMLICLWYPPTHGQKTFSPYICSKSSSGGRERNRSLQYYVDAIVKINITSSQMCSEYKELTVLQDSSQGI